VTVTFPIEGAHSTLKAFLNTSRNDLKGVVDVVNQLHQVQFGEIRADLASKRDRISHGVNARYNSWSRLRIITSHGCAMGYGTCGRLHELCCLIVGVGHNLIISEAAIQLIMADSDYHYGPSASSRRKMRAVNISL